MSKIRDLLIGSITEAKSMDLWLVRDEDDSLFLTTQKPKFDKDFGWMKGKGDTYIILPDNLYPEVKSGTKEPQRVRLTLV